MLLFQQKNILILHLAIFIHFNKTIASKQLANLFEHGQEKRCKNPLHKLLTSQIVADFNLGKKTKQEFISEALHLLNLSSNKALGFELAWNSLLEFDEKLLDVFNELMILVKQGLSLYFIGNTNELHAQKVLDLFKDRTSKKLTWVENLTKPMAASPLTMTETSQARLNDNALEPSLGNVYFCLSYFFQSLIEQPSCQLTQFFTSESTSGLLTQLLAYLKTQNTTKEAILLVNPYEKENTITKKFALEMISKNHFFSELRSSARGNVLSLSLLDSLSIELPSISTEHSFSNPSHHLKS